MIPILEEMGWCTRFHVSMEDYIGETKRILGTHLKELRLQWTSLPLLSMPAPSISIVDQAKKYKLLQLKEALHILLSEQKRLMNRDPRNLHRWLFEVASEKSA